MSALNAYDYLSCEYERLNSKRRKIGDFNDYLERNKERYCKDKALYESDKILFKKLEDIASKLKLPIEEQNRSTYAIISRHSDNINKVMKENNIHISNDIVVGTLPINELNAFVYPFPNGQILLVLNDGLIQFIYLMGRVVASFFTKKDEDKETLTFDFDKEIILENLKNNKDGHNKFIETLFLYFAYDDMDISSIYFEKDENKGLSGVLYDNAELFVVAHEYSHILLDHLSLDKKSEKRFLDEESSLYQIVRGWEDEFYADSLALQAVLAHNRNKINGWFMGYMGVELCLSCLDIIEKFKNTRVRNSHPFAEMRRMNIRNSLKKLLPEHYEKIIDIGKNIEEIVLELWDTNKDIVNVLCK